MQVSKLKITQDTLNNNLLSHKRKRDLRRQAIKEYVVSRGTNRIRIEEFQSVGRFNNAPSAHYFVQQMVNRRELVRHEITPRKFYYTVPSKVIVKKPRLPRMSHDEIEAAMQTFIWKRGLPEDISALRRFSQYLKEVKS